MAEEGGIDAAGEVAGDGDVRLEGEFDGGAGEVVENCEGGRVLSPCVRLWVRFPVGFGLAGAVILNEGPVGGGEGVDVLVEGVGFGEVAEGEPGVEVGQVGGEGDSGRSEGLDFGGESEGAGFG